MCPFRNYAACRAKTFYLRDFKRYINRQATMQNNPLAVLSDRAHTMRHEDAHGQFLHLMPDARQPRCS